MAKPKVLQKRHIAEKPAKPEKLTPEKVAHALTLSGGLVATAARKLKVARSTVYDYIDRHESVKEARDEAREFTLDEAESQLLKAVKNHESWAIAFTLKTLGRYRGYSEKIEIENPGGIATAPTTVQIVPYSRKDDALKPPASIQFVPYYGVDENGKERTEAEWDARHSVKPDDSSEGGDE